MSAWQTNGPIQSLKLGLGFVLLAEVCPWLEPKKSDCLHGQARANKIKCGLCFELYMWLHDCLHQLFYAVKLSILPVKQVLGLLYLLYFNVYPNSCI